jgi:hypothetical protein
MRLLVTASFVKATKKLHQPQNVELDAALKTVSSDPLIGEAKVGDLLGVRVCWPIVFWMRKASSS